MKNYQAGYELLSRWEVVKPDGKPFPLEDYHIEIACYAGRAQEKAHSMVVYSGEGNAVVWTIPAAALKFLGPYSLVMSLYKDGQLYGKVIEQDAFRIVAVAQEKGLSLNIKSTIYKNP